MKRPKQHKIDSAAKTILRKNVPEYWSLAEPSEDYGIDYLVHVFDKETDEVTRTTFIIQLKGTTNYKKDGNFVKFSIGTDYLKYYYTKVGIPVFLVVVDVINEECCWLFIQEYINEELSVNKPTWKSQKSNTLYIPTKNTFSNPEVIEKSALEGFQYCNILVNGTPTQELIWKVKNITDNPSEKARDLKDIYSQLYDEETKLGFEFIHNQNNPDNAKKAFQSVYDKTNGDDDNILPHLNSIIGLTPFLSWHNENEREILFQYIKEGEQLSKENGIEYLEHYFYGYRLEQLCFILQNQLQDLLITQKIANMQQGNILSNIVEISTSPEIKRIFGFLHKLYADFSTNLLKALDGKEIFIFLELLGMLIAMKLHHIQVRYTSTDENTLNLLFKQIEQLISIFKNLINLCDDFEIFQYDEYVFEITYCYLIEDERYNELIDEFIDFSKEKDSQYNLERANSFKDKVSKPLHKKEDSEMSDDEIHDLYKTLILTIEGIDIDSDDSELGLILKQAVMDLNPKRVLDNCSNLELAYSTGGQYARFFGLFSDGYKRLYCKHGGMTIDRSLDEAYDKFSSKFCNNCEHRIGRDFKWNTDELSHVKSDEFKDILKKDTVLKWII